MENFEENKQFYDELGDRIYKILETKIRRHAIGIGVLDEHSNPKIIGSGTLAILNENPIIITAAHVSEIIEKLDSCYIINFCLDIQKYNQIKVDLSHSGFEFQFRGNRTDCGPDISFFTINESERSSLETVGCVFKNMNDFYDQNLNIPSKEALNFSMGVIQEEVKVIYHKQEVQVNVFLSSLIGIINKIPDNLNYDRYIFKKNFNLNGGEPNSYGGVSGAGVWEIANITANPEEDSVINFLGVIYYETEIKTDGGRDFIFNGPKSVRKLLSNVFK